MTEGLGKYISTYTYIHTTKNVHIHIHILHFNYMYNFLYLGTIPASSQNKQVLDKLQVERERGITVKAQTVTLCHIYKGKEYLLNLIDTPVSFQFSSSTNWPLQLHKMIITFLTLSNIWRLGQNTCHFFISIEATTNMGSTITLFDRASFQLQSAICSHNHYQWHCEEKSCGRRIDMLNCNNAINMFELQSYSYIQSWTNTLGKVIEPS